VNESVAPEPDETGAPFTYSVDRLTEDSLAKIWHEVGYQAFAVRVPADQYNAARVFVTNLKVGESPLAGLVSVARTDDYA
jgi:hypothetical protein